MSGGQVAVTSGSELEQEVANLAGRLGLRVGRQIRVGRRLWGAERRIDLARQSVLDAMCL